MTQGKSFLFPSKTGKGVERVESNLQKPLIIQKLCNSVLYSVRLVQLLSLDQSKQIDLSLTETLRQPMAREEGWLVNRVKSEREIVSIIDTYFR